MSQKQGVATPWGLVRDSLGDAVRSRWLETAAGGGGAVEWDAAGAWCLRVPEPSNTPDVPAPAPNAANVELAELAVNQVQDLAEAIPKLLNASAGSGLRFRIGVLLNPDASDSMRRQVDSLLEEIAPGLKSDLRP